jgi:putative phage-type endonuclease
MITRNYGEERLIIMDNYKEIISQDDINGWIEAHKLGIGASQIAAVLGEHRFGSRLRVWAEKVGRLEPADLSNNESVHWGLTLEPLVATEYQKRTKRSISRAGTLLQSTTYDWAICTPDYWLMDGDGGWVVPLQIKTTSAFRLKDWADGPPIETWWQVQHEMFVTGAPWASCGVLVGGNRFMWADVKRDQTAIDRIIVEGAAFWEQVKNKTYPDPDANASDVIVELFQSAAEGEELALPPEAIEWDSDLSLMKIERIALDERIKELENNLKLCIGPAERGVLLDGSGAYTYKNQSRWNFSLADGESKPIDPEGEFIKGWATRSDFRVLRRSGGK